LKILTIIDKNYADNFNNNCLNKDEVFLKLIENNGFYCDLEKNQICYINKIKINKYNKQENKLKTEQIYYNFAKYIDDIIVNESLQQILGKNYILFENSIIKLDVELDEYLKKYKTSNKKLGTIMGFFLQENLPFTIDENTIAGYYTNTPKALNLAQQLNLTIGSVNEILPFTNKKNKYFYIAFDPFKDKFIFFQHKKQLLDYSNELVYINDDIRILDDEYSFVENKIIDTIIYTDYILQKTIKQLFIMKIVKDNKYTIRFYETEDDAIDTTIDKFYDSYEDGDICHEKMSKQLRKNKKFICDCEIKETFNLQTLDV